MMFDLDKYLRDLVQNCRTVFGERLLYIGLQGSYLRGEDNENSDIDVMVILDRFSMKDMDSYREIFKNDQLLREILWLYLRTGGNNPLEPSGGLPVASYD